MVIKGMTRAEMILKVVMDASDTNVKYVNQYLRLLPDSDAAEFQKILDMKGIRRSDQQQLIDLFKTQKTSDTTDRDDVSIQYAVQNSVVNRDSNSPDHESSRIKKLEKLIKRRL